MSRTSLIAIALLLAARAAGAQDWPTRPVTMVVPYAAGGPTDAVGRVVAQRLSVELGQQVVVENIGGAGGMTGSSRVAHAAPDGNTFLFAGAGSQVFNQLLYKKPLYDAVTDFTPVALLTEQGLVLIVRKELPANRFGEFIDYLKTNTNANFGSAGAGSTTHLGCVFLNVAIGVNASHVPYRGAAPAMQDLIAGRIDYMCDLTPDALPQIEGRTVKPIAMLTRLRSPVLPALPTAAEQGLVDFDGSSWYGLFLPKGTPAAIVRKLHDAAAAALENQVLRGRLQSLGVEVVAPERRSSEYLASFLKQELVKWAAPIKASGITAD